VWTAADEAEDRAQKAFDKREAAKKAQRSSTDIIGNALMEGFKKVCWGDRYDELNKYEKHLASRGKETKIPGRTRAGVGHTQHRKGAEDKAGAEANQERLRRKVGKTKRGDMPATPRHLMTAAEQIAADKKETEKLLKQSKNINLTDRGIRQSQGKVGPQTGTNRPQKTPHNR